MIIVGSTALSIFRPDLNIKPKDLDIMVLDYMADNFYGDVIKIPPKLYMRLVNYCRVKNYQSNDEWVLPPDALLTLKASHLQYDNKWEKTKRDVISLINLGYKVIPELFSILSEHWKEDYGNKDFLSLNKNKVDFFNDFVDYKYDHDYLHELVAYPDKPVYTKCLKDGSEVLICKNKFDNLPEYDRLQMFREEVTVIALERWLYNDKSVDMSWMQAYNRALKLTITRLTKGWASEFMALNIKELSKQKYSTFKHAIEILNKGEN